MNKLKAVLAAISVATTAMTGVIVSTTPASAEVVKSNCFYPRRPGCLYYNSSAYGYGAEFGTWSNIPSFNPAYGTGDTYVFIAGNQGSAGAGWSVWNQAAAARNRDFDYGFVIYANHGYAGAAETIAPSTTKNLNATHNNDTSLKWLW